MDWAVLDRDLHEHGVPEDHDESVEDEWRGRGDLENGDDQRQDELHGH